MNSSISVVLPAYNEEENIEKTARNCITILNTLNVDSEIIIVNDGSDDNTGDIIEKLSKENNSIIGINHEKNMGYGTTLNSGLEQAKMNYIFFMDSDGQFNFNEITKLLPYVSEENIIIGYRIKRADNLIRSLNAFLYNIYIRSFFGLKVRDIDCAFKLFPKSAFDSVRPIKSRGALYSAELLLKFVRNGYKIKEIGVNHFPRSYGEQSGANLSVILRMFKESWKFRKELI